jgi:hypothetical protein
MQFAGLRAGAENFLLQALLFPKMSAANCQDGQA